MQTSVEITSGGLTLRGTLHTPEGKNETTPLVVVYHSFSGSRVDAHFLHVHLSRALETRGVACLRFDFAGSGESDGEFADMTLSKEIADAEAIFAYAKSLPFSARIGLVGHSLGGAIASIIAGRHPDEVSAISLWAAAGNFGTLVRSGELSPFMNRALKTGSADFNGLTISREFVEDAFRVDCPENSIYTQASPFHGPALLIHGEMDAGVPLASTLGYAALYGDRARLFVVEGADHYFNNKLWEDAVIGEAGAFFEANLQ